MEGRRQKKDNKTRRETAVQGTNDSSVVSKCSTAACGYTDDHFLHHFVSKSSRRAPLIHRGYYIRAFAFERIIKNFLSQHTDSKTQIVSLGCGFDSTYFRLKNAGVLGNTVFYEIDFPELVKRKHLLIENVNELKDMMTKTKEQPSTPHIELSCQDYHLMGVDLTQLNTLEAALKICGVDFECPTFVFSECVMTYMTRRCSTDLIKWTVETFEDATFTMYEQIHPDDAFGLFMQNHFHSIGSPLKCINAFPTLGAQKSRFLNSGWDWCEAYDMNMFYNQCVNPSEKKRLESLETFDEYEELNLKYSHYFILTASTSPPPSSLFKERPSQDLKGLEDGLSPSTPGLIDITWPSIERSVHRFGHASSIVNNRYVITSGGFGELDGRHQRLTEITITDLKSLESYHLPCVASDIQYSRMHHASVTLSNGDTYLLGGRQSPHFMCGDMLKISFVWNAKSELTNSAPAQGEAGCDNVHSRTGLSHSTNNSNHTCVGSSGADKQSNGDTVMDVCDSHQCISNVSSNLAAQVEESISAKEKCPGSNINGSHHNHLDDSSEVSSNSISVQTLTCPFGRIHVQVLNQAGTVPCVRWRHAATAVMFDDNEKIFLHGGKTKGGQVLNDTYIYDPITSEWSEMSCTGEKPPALHSHCAAYWEGKVFLTGGLDDGQRPSLAVFVLDLSRRVWERMDVSGNLYARYSHTVQVIGDHLLLVGGVHLFHPPPGIAVINLIYKNSTEFLFPEQCKNKLLMYHRHTSVQVDSKNLLLIGGGGNCFSFGTHLNHTPVILNISKCLEVSR